MLRECRCALKTPGTRLAVFRQTRWPGFVSGAGPRDSTRSCSVRFRPPTSLRPGPHRPWLPALRLRQSSVNLAARQLHPQFLSPPTAADSSQYIPPTSTTVHSEWHSPPSETAPAGHSQMPSLAGKPECQRSPAGACRPSTHLGSALHSKPRLPRPASLRPADSRREVLEPPNREPRLL